MITKISVFVALVVVAAVVVNADDDDYTFYCPCTADAPCIHMRDGSCIERVDSSGNFVDEGGTCAAGTYDCFGAPPPGEYDDDAATSCPCSGTTPCIHGGDGTCQQRLGNDGDWTDEGGTCAFGTYDCDLFNSGDDSMRPDDDNSRPGDDTPVGSDDDDDDNSPADDGDDAPVRADDDDDMPMADDDSVDMDDRGDDEGHHGDDDGHHDSDDHGYGDDNMWGDDVTWSDDDEVMADLTGACACLLTGPINSPSYPSYADDDDDDGHFPPSYPGGDDDDWAPPASEFPSFSDGGNSGGGHSGGGGPSGGGHSGAFSMSGGGGHSGGGHSGGGHSGGGHSGGGHSGGGHSGGGHSGGGHSGGGHSGGGHSGGGHSGGGGGSSGPESFMSEQSFSSNTNTMERYLLETPIVDAPIIDAPHRARTLLALTAEDKEDKINPEAPASGHNLEQECTSSLAHLCSSGMPELGYVCMMCGDGYDVSSACIDVLEEVVGASGLCDGGHDDAHDDNHGGQDDWGDDWWDDDWTWDDDWWSGDDWAGWFDDDWTWDDDWYDDDFNWEGDDWQTDDDYWSRFVWNQGPWGDCNVVCGSGVQSRDVWCENSFNRFEYLDFYCDAAGRPEGVQSCDMGDCEEFYWEVGAWETCSVSCGGGTKRRQVACMSSAGGVAEDESSCVAWNKPVATETCNTLACVNYYWTSGAWMECDASCGGGTQNRVASCVSNQGVSAPRVRCEEAALNAMPATSQTCNTEDCPSYYFLYGAWGQCSEACYDGTTQGMKTRTATCMEDGVALDTLDACIVAGVNLEVLSQACNSSPCNIYSWKVSPYGSCSATCGGGVKTREVLCLAINLFTGVAEETSADNCSGVSSFGAPESETACNTITCAAAFCENEDCYGNGVCSNGACTCDDGFTGTYCSLSEACSTGVFTRSGACCESGMLDKNSQCCAASSVIDFSGLCCAGTLDACGACDGNAITVDVQGTCCSKDLPPSNICCEGVTDVCGVCDGDGTSCNSVVDMTVSVDDTTGLDDPASPEYAAYTASMTENVAEAIGVDASNVEISSVVLGATARRIRARALATAVDVEFTVNSASSGVGMYAVQNKLASSSSLGISAMTLDTRGVCGNGQCEAEEACASAQDRDCCRSDCPYTALTCPSVNSRPCSGHGVCLSGTGVCQCSSNSGYSGESCSECATGYTLFNGECIIRVTSFTTDDDDDAPVVGDDVVDEDKEGGGFDAGLIGGVVAAGLVALVAGAYALGKRGQTEERARLNERQDQLQAQVNELRQSANPSAPIAVALPVGVTPH